MAKSAFPVRQASICWRSMLSLKPHCNAQYLQAGNTPDTTPNPTPVAYTARASGTCDIMHSME